MSAPYAPKHFDATFPSAPGSPRPVDPYPSYVRMFYQDTRPSSDITFEEGDFWHLPTTGELYLWDAQLADWLLTAKASATGAGDSSVANLIADPASSTRATLDSAYAPKASARPGNRIAYLGDSITQASWQNSTNLQGPSYPLFAMLASGGRLLVARNAGKSGDTTAGALSRFDAEVTPYSPTAVMVTLGTNDAGSGTVTLAQYASNMRSIVTKIRGLRATPILGTIPPNNDSARHAKINTWNAWLRNYAATEGIAIVDFYKLLADPANANYLATYNTDGTHPNTAGYIAMGQAVADALTSLTPPWAPYKSQDNVDSLNALTSTNSVMLTDANADGVPDGWFAYGGSAGYAHALVTDTQVVGKMAQITQTANGSLRAMQKSVSGWNVGDKIAVSGVITSDGGVLAQVKTSFAGAGTSAQAAQFQGAVTRGTFYQELTVPAATTGVTLDLIANAGTGVVAWGQVTVINLTTSQIATV